MMQDAEAWTSQVDTLKSTTDETQPEQLEFFHLQKK